ncbi:flavin monoamine oxidase family protein [Luteibacter yeojuensis]|uniref:Tryptophan 2-monooxygenase n=1 Tax=Luteibacter yeojuensis TaxID=345309 RepID=A0A7X5QX23_9GAMM|nr:flavin monoamine oxidase family protein [Luteibacter yeojuensis]NID17003.1 flavin monoamine oxidase family protein [Luteibacter yeojuensis]
MGNDGSASMTRRDLLRMIGLAGGGALMYQAMTGLGFAAESPYRKPPPLQGTGRGSVLILGAGLAGLVAAYELGKAGYKVQVLEYNARAGGRNWTLRGGDEYTELGGYRQRCRFDEGQYFNPGPWRIPYHHAALLDYCRRFGVALEPFVQVNHNAYLHGESAMGGKPQRMREVQADFNGGVSELLAKVAGKGGLDDQVSKEDKEMLLEAMRGFGGLDNDYRYVAGHACNSRRGYAKDAGAGPDGAPVFSQPVGLHDVLGSHLWKSLGISGMYEFQTTLMQPVGGMDAIGKAFLREIRPDVIRYNAKVTRVAQDERGVTVNYEDTTKPGHLRQATADWCVCTIPLSILSQIPIQVSEAKVAAIGAVPYWGSVKVGLQFRRRFWEEDEAIYGGITATDLPIGMISYPSHGFGTRKGVLLGAYTLFLEAYRYTAMDPAERIRRAVEDGTKIHPQYAREFENGMAVAWHRSPGTLGCFGGWTEEARAKHYADICSMDGRIVLAGEHASYLPAWQEGAILSSLSAIDALHRRAVAGAGA